MLGGGPAGDVAALRAAQLGARPVIERAELGGTCLNWGCIPTKSLLATADLLRRVRRADEYGLVVPEVSFDFPKMMSRKEERAPPMRKGVEGAAKRKGVTVVRGEGRVEGDEVVVDGERHPYDHLVVCVGTEPVGLPGFDMDHPAVLTSNEILGAGEGARRRCSWWAAASSAASSQASSRPSAPGSRSSRSCPACCRHRQAHREPVPEADREGGRGRPPRPPGAEITDYRDDGVTVSLDDGTEICAEKLLVSVGRRSQAAGIGLEEIGVEITERGHVVVDEYLRTANPKVWGVGDCIGGLQLAHLASAEGARAVENAAGGEMLPMDRTVVPSCIYTHPEIATVGLNADAAKEAGYNVKLGQARFGGSGKALGEGEPDGYAQLVMDAETRLLLGATIMGVHAVEMIHEIGVAIAEGLTASELGEVIHAHPTVCEMVMDAAQQAVGVAPYLS